MTDGHATSKLILLVISAVLVIVELLNLFFGIDLYAKFAILATSDDELKFILGREKYKTWRFWFPIYNCLLELPDWRIFRFAKEYVAKILCECDHISYSTQSGSTSVWASLNNHPKRSSYHHSFSEMYRAVVFPRGD
jgi:hypothetical protein